MKESNELKEFRQLISDYVGVDDLLETARRNFTPREAEIVQFLESGLNPSEIAERLGVGGAKMSHTIHQIIRKLRMTSIKIQKHDT